MRSHALFVGLIVAGCSSSSGGSGSGEKPMGDHTKKLLQQHTEIWKMMGLSEPAQKELNAIVVGVEGALEKNKQAHPELFGKEPKRAKQPTHDEYMAAHKKRFDALKISAATQKELLASAEFVWKALHDPAVAPKDKEVAMKIKDMMKMGPPPCCDDNIFEKAK